MVIAAAVLAYKGWRSLSGHPDVGAFFAFFGALLVAGQALRQVANLSTVVSQGLAAGRRLFAALDVRPEVRDARGAPGRCASMPAMIALRGVSFSYGEAAPVLHEVTIEARRGETVALGRSIRRGQDDGARPDPAVLRRRRRRGRHRRPGRARREPEVPAPRDCVGDARALPVRRHHRRQHRLFARVGEPAARSRPPRATPPRTTSSSPCPRATTPSLARPACGSPAVSASASPSRGRC